MQNSETYFGQPIFIWEALANFASVLLAGLIIAFVTTFYLKKKDERTRVAGVILEKRVQAQQDILQFVESNTQKMEMRQAESAGLREIMLHHDLQLPYDPHIQYAEIFSSVAKFRRFFRELEQVLEKNKLWLDLKVRRHIQLMSAYFASINAFLIVFNRIPLPAGVTLSASDFDNLADRLLFIVGAALDEELNHLVMDLEVRMVGSIYNLDLKRPKTGIFSKRYASKEVRKVEKFLYQESLLGAYMPHWVPLIINLVQAHKKIEITPEDAMAYYERFSTSTHDDKAGSFL